MVATCENEQALYTASETETDVLVTVTSSLNGHPVDDFLETNKYLHKTERGTLQIGRQKAKTFA